MDMALDALTDISDDALLVLYATGDSTAAATLTLRLTPMVFRLASRVLNDRTEAEDVVQEAMMRLWKMAPDWRQGEAKLSTWLYRVTSNLCTDRLRKRKSIGLDQIVELRDERPDMDSHLHAKDRAAALRAAMVSLPARQRQAVILRHFEGLANPEIADVLNVSVEAVESLLARGKRNLAHLLVRQKAELGLDK